MGKEKAARAFAAALLCRKPGTDGACGSNARLPAARVRRPSQLPFIAPEKQFLRIDEIRALKEELSLKAFSDRPRVAILCPADRMTPQAANALLKTLEEPPAGDAPDPRRPQGLGPPTIVSRCQKIPFFPLAAGAVAEICPATPTWAGSIRPVIVLAAKVSGGKPGACASRSCRARGGAGSVARALARSSPRRRR